MRRALCLAALTLACRKTPPAPRPTPPQAVAPVSRDAAAPADVAPDAARADAAPAAAPNGPDAAPGRATAPATDLRGDAHVDALVAVPGGAIHVQAINREARRASEIVATALDAEGLPRGPARLLRRTTGPITALDASAQGESLWVAWGAVRPVGEEGASPERGEFIVAAVRATVDLTTVGRPVTIEDFRAVIGEAGDMEPQVIPGLSVGVVAADDGGAHVAASSPLQTCLHEEGTDHASREPCRAWGLTAVTPDGHKSRHAEGILAMVRGPYGLLRVPQGFVFAFDDDHIGSKSTFVAEALGPGPAPFPSVTHWHYREVVFAAAGGAVYARGAPTEQDMPGAAHGAIVALDRAHAATTPIRTEDSGDQWPALDDVALRCREGRPVLALRWAGGGATLDPAAPGTSFRWDDWLPPDALPRPPGGAADDGAAHAVVWAGRALVGVVGDARVRWRCDARAAVVLAPSSVGRAASP